jgi:hypothetical protein
MTKKARASRAMSSMEFVMAPDPKAVTRPVTVELCQSRAQWSTLLVEISPLASFWTR